MARRFVPVALALAIALEACGSDSSTGETTGSLRSADSVRGEEAVTGAAGVVGTPAELAGMNVTVQSITPTADDGGPLIDVAIRVENPTSAELSLVDFGVICNGSPDTGGWQADSTYDINEPVPAGTFDEGVVKLLVPGDGRFGEPRPACGTPAKLVISSGGERVVWPIDDAVIDAVNKSPQVTNP